MGKGESIGDAAESEEISDSFICSICLDLLYKPIVLPCGHVSCFWCVHHSMDGIYESHCPICRHSYYHFPTICQMLHVLLLKMYPIAYKRREEQILAEERKIGVLSPQFDCNGCGSHAEQGYDHLKDLERSSTAISKSNSCSEPCLTGKEDPNVNCKQLLITDVQCTACKQLLFRPVFLNCGHGFCETCISCPVDEMLRCQVCQSLNPTGMPKVCLELDHFVEDLFPRDYALIRDAVQLKQAHTKIENPASCSMRASSKGFPFSSVTKKELSHAMLHQKVGCDSCGMYPIIGKRYWCIDCVKICPMSYDLCGDCYNTSSKLPGRFNQQHTPEHKLVCVNSNNSIMRLEREGYWNASFAFTNHDDPSERPEGETEDSHLSTDAEDNAGSSLIAPDIGTESADDQNETQSSSNS